jgi:periplasmic protein TonB
MKRDDWTGVGVSFGLHLVLLLLFAVFTSSALPQPMGMIEVEFGPIETAAPAARAPVQQPTPTQTRPEPQREQPAPRTQPQRAEPVNLAQRRDVVEQERVPPPQPDPRPQPQPAQPESRPQQPVAERAPQDQPGGTPTGADGTTSATGDPGDSAARRAPFNIQGLNRSVQYYPLPRNPGARGTSVLRFCVTPDGSVSSAAPLRRTGNPSLDNAALAAVRQWRFNPLPPAAPQENQCGELTFYFDLN